MANRTSTLLLALMMTTVGCAEESAPGLVNDGLPETKEEAADMVNEGKADWGIDLCAIRGWYNDGGCDWICSDPDPDCDIPSLGPEPQGVATQYPLVFVHGLGSGAARGFTDPVLDAVKADGHAVFEVDLAPFQSVRNRASELAPQIDRILRETGAAKVNLIAHSMGGLDSRYLIHTLGYGDRIASLTTISTPHMGTAVADTVLSVAGLLGDRRINEFAESMAPEPRPGVQDDKVVRSTDVRAALQDLTEAGAVQRSQGMRQDERVYYQSWTGVSTIRGVGFKDGEPRACMGRFLTHPAAAPRMNQKLAAMATILRNATNFLVLDNDGVVPVMSGRYGDFRGCFPADHTEEQGPAAVAGPNYGTGFDAARFYRNMAFELASLGY